MNAMPGSPHRIDLSTTLNRVGLAMRDLGQMITAIEASILDSVQVNTSEMPVPPVFNNWTSRFRRSKSLHC